MVTRPSVPDPEIDAVVAIDPAAKIKTNNTITVHEPAVLIPFIIPLFDRKSKSLIVRIKKNLTNRPARKQPPLFTGLSNPVNAEY